MTRDEKLAAWRLYGHLRHDHDVAAHALAGLHRLDQLADFHTTLAPGCDW